MVTCELGDIVLVALNEDPSYIIYDEPTNYGVGIVVKIKYRETIKLVFIRWISAPARYYYNLPEADAYIYEKRISRVVGKINVY